MLILVWALLLVWTLVFVWVLVLALVWAWCWFGAPDFQSTRVACMRRSAAAGSPQNPGCTFEDWRIVLRVAVSQRKRLARSSCAIGPPSLLPFVMASKACRCCSSSAMSSFG